MFVQTACDPYLSDARFNSETESSSESEPARKRRKSLALPPARDFPAERERHKPKKARALLSCLSCRLSRTKCSDFRPCNRCQRTGKASTCTIVIAVSILHPSLWVEARKHNYSVTCVSFMYSCGCRTRETNHQNRQSVSSVFLSGDRLLQHKANFIQDGN